MIFRQLYSGLSLAIIRLYASLKLYIFNTLCSSSGGLSGNPLSNGLISGALATVIINPLDILKNHRQTSTCVPSKKIPVIIREIMNVHGFHGFTHGMKYNVLRGSIISSGEYGTYFYMKESHSQLNPCVSGGVAGAATAIVVLSP